MLWKFFEKLDDENKEIIITGDFNCDLLKKDYVNPNIKMMKDLIDIYQLQQHIDKPSRTTNYSQTLIDLILTKIEDNKTIDSGVIELGISDHSLVYIQLFQLRLSPVQSGKSNTSAKGCWESLINSFIY
jgi:endonuclease/exonuclease/phosphatase family metal-dependent hydrolase